MRLTSQRFHIVHAKELGPGKSYRHCPAILKTHAEVMTKMVSQTGVQIGAKGRAEQIYVSSVDIQVRIKVVF